MKRMINKMLLVSLVFVSAFTSCTRRTSSSDLVDENTNSSISISSKNTSIKVGSTFVVTVTVHSKYKSLYWSSQNVYLYSDNYDAISFVKWELPDKSDGPEDIMGEVISDNSYYQCGIYYEKKHSSSKDIVYNVTFKLNNDSTVDEINFYLKPNVGCINSYKDSEGNYVEERKDALDASNTKDNKFIISVVK